MALALGLMRYIHGEATTTSNMQGARSGRLEGEWCLSQQYRNLMEEVEATQMLS